MKLSDYSPKLLDRAREATTHFFEKAFWEEDIRAQAEDHVQYLLPILKEGGIVIQDNSASSTNQRYLRLTEIEIKRLTQILM